MSERDMFSRPHRVENVQANNDEGGLRAPPGLSLLGKAWWWFHFLILVKLARLRFIVVMIAIGIVIAKWDLLSAWYDKLTRPLATQEAGAGSDSEYWCPMHPNIVRDHPDTCPICRMDLSKRKKGEKHTDEAFPPDVVSRVQLTPYKVAVAGIETVEIGYRSLTRDIDAVGFVEFDERKLAHIASRQKGRIVKLFVNYTGQMVDEGEKLAVVDVRYSRELMVLLDDLKRARGQGDRASEELARQALRVYDVGEKQIEEFLRDGKINSEMTLTSPIHGHVIKKYRREGDFVEDGTALYDVADLSTVWLEAQVYEDDLAFIQDAVERKLAVTANTKAFPNREFKGTIEFVHPHLDAATRTVMVRFNLKNPNHELRPGIWASVRLQAPLSRAFALPADADHEKQQKYQQGQILVVPERAVIDTGSHKFVYREAGPDSYEGVMVELGPRCNDDYPVLRGLKAGDKVVTTGSFLIDAETRLSPDAGSTYYGATGAHAEHSTTKSRTSPSTTRDEERQVDEEIAKLQPADRQRARAQRFCPILTKNRLGKMGTPYVVEIKGRKVFLCCEGCKEDALKEPEKTLAQVEKLKNNRK
jgi:Cu(I)/Ag(I) efflux system membrane fusion protein